MNNIKKNKPVYVTQPDLPQLDEYVKYLKKIWGNKWLTNNGEFHKRFEKNLAEYLGVKYVSLFANGTLALITAIQALGLKGEVITTPYSFVATAHSLVWNKLTPVFIDVDANGNLNPDEIEKAITDKTSAILPVHVYGNPCQHEKIEEVAIKHNLKLFYDAAHAFGVREKGKSILDYGDLSILSFHATKVFNTAEGGAIISHSKEMKEHIDHLKNFGFVNEVTVIGTGINAKMNELQAAFGLLQLKTIDKKIQKRKNIVFKYRELLDGIEGVSFFCDFENVTHNYAYFPIFIEKEKYGMSRDELYNKLKEHNIYGRRYFYPLISHFPAYTKLESANSHNLPVAEMIAERVICLPVYPELEPDIIKNISDIIRHN